MIKKKSVLQAVEILRDLNRKYYEDSSKKKPLLGDEEESTLYLQVTLKKIPGMELIKMIKVPLPHPLLKESDEVCLITGDLDKKNHKAEIEPDILHYKQLLEKHGISRISQVVTLRQLRTDYKPYEAKQKLLAAYDMFLADKKIAGCLPRVLGKHFFKKRKFPIQIDMKSSNLKNQIEKALSTKVFPVTGHGNTCCSEIAFLDMDDSEILDNIQQATKTLSEHLPGLWDNVMGMYLKTSKSKAIPLYMSYENFNEVQIKEEVNDDVIVDELSTFPNVNVKVFSNGYVRTFPCKEELYDKESAEKSINLEELEQSDEEAKEPNDQSVRLLSDTDLELPKKDTKKSKKLKKQQQTTEETEMSCIAKEPERVTEKSIGRKKKGIDLEELKSSDEKAKEPNDNKEKSEAVRLSSDISEKNMKKSKKLKKQDSETEMILTGFIVEEPESVAEKSIGKKRKGSKKLQEPTKQSKKLENSKKVLEKTELPDNDSENENTTVLQSKKKIKNVKSSLNDLKHTSSQDSVQKAKKSKKAEKDFIGKDSLLSTSNESRVKKVLTKKKKDTVSSSLEKGPVEKLNTKPTKRKQTEEASDLIGNEHNFETDQVCKKRKIDGINMKRYNARKEERKSKKKKGSLPR